VETQTKDKISIKPEIAGRLFFKGTLKNITPLTLSNGQDEYSDADIYRDIDGTPVITSTAFTGALKSYFEGNYPHLTKSITYKYLFGDSGRQGKYGLQAHFILDDLKCISDYKTNIRDGVKIDSKTNLAVDQGKYDYEILEPGATFSLSGEITSRQGIDAKEIDKILQIVQSILNSGYFQVGGLTSFGFGRLQLDKGIKSTGLLQKEKYIEYITNPAKFSFDHQVESADLKSNYNLSIFKFQLRPTTPLFIGGGEIKADNADDASLKSDGKYILSAKSLKGAIRHHAFRIANTIHGEDVAHKVCNEIFGNRAKEEKEKTELTKSKFWTSDGFIIDNDKINSQSQVAIDRFTGGAIESALFATEPVWPKSDTYVDIEWRIPTEPIHLGLLLLVARDLMTEMLPIGGDRAIGRGRFEAIEASLDDTNIKTNRTWSDDDLSKINGYIQAFLDFKTIQHGAQ
jgi:CRISPR/Cas system CSM-associated protein Csm3 (group 7 of RAMP superfamily)